MLNVDLIGGLICINRNKWSTFLDFLTANLISKYFILFLGNITSNFNEDILLD